VPFGRFYRPAPSLAFLNLRARGGVVRGALVGSALLLAILVITPSILDGQASLAVNIEELMAGANGDSTIQFIVVRRHGADQHRWGPGSAAQSRAMLVFFDAAGRETGVFKFPADPPDNSSQRTLIATAAFAQLPGAPLPDVVLPPLMHSISGKVCFRNNPANSSAPERSHCISYGGFTGDTGSNEQGIAAGPPAPALPIIDVYLGAPVATPVDAAPGVC
jgi:hypothetical protein